MWFLYKLTKIEKNFGKMLLQLCVDSDYNLIEL